MKASAASVPSGISGISRLGVRLSQLQGMASPRASRAVLRRSSPFRIDDAAERKLVVWRGFMQKILSVSVLVMTLGLSGCDWFQGPAGPPGPPGPPAPLGQRAIKAIQASRGPAVYRGPIRRGRRGSDHGRNLSGSLCCHRRAQTATSRHLPASIPDRVRRRSIEPIDSHGPGIQGQGRRDGG